MIRAVAAILAAGTIPSASAIAGPPKPITVLELKEPSGVQRTNFPVTTGVPLPMGTLDHPGNAALLDADGRPVPAQFEVLSRWIPSSPKSITYCSKPPNTSSFNTVPMLWNLPNLSLTIFSILIHQPR